MQLTQLVALRSALALFLAACVFVLPVEGQIRFQKSYSGNQDYTPIALTSTSEGGYAILANTQISPPDSQIIHQDYSLTVTGEDGAILWTKSFGNESDNTGLAVVEAVDKGLLVVGQSRDLDNGWLRATISKVDGQGKLSWTKQFTTVDGAFTDIVMSADSNYIAVGYDKNNLLAFKLNADGAVLWKKSFNLNVTRKKVSIAACREGGFVMGGSYQGGAFVVRANKDGKTQWTHKFESKNEIQTSDIIETTDKGFLLSGSEILPNGRTQMIAVKTNPSGSHKWAKTYLHDESIRNYGLTEDRVGIYVLSGHCGSLGKNQDLAILKIGLDGSMISGHQFGGKGIENGGYGIQTTADSGLVMLGCTQSFATREGAVAAYLVKLDGKDSSGGYQKSMTLKERRILPYERKENVRSTTIRENRKVKFGELEYVSNNVLIEENLICGNVEAPLDPRKVVLEQARLRDSLALVALHDSTMGLNWRRRWDLEQPMNSWHNVQLDHEGRVVGVVLTANQLNGFLPNSLGNMNKLEILWLGTNSLEGTIPTSFGKMINLKQLFLEDNNLQGGIPVELTELPKLQQLRLGKNKLEGNVPIEFGSMKTLTSLSLEDNLMSGEIPEQLDSLILIGAELNLSNNGFIGAVPKEMLVSKLAQLMGNEFEPHFQAKLQDKIGGYYESMPDQNIGNSFVLFLNEKTKQFTLLKGSYDEEGGKYVQLKGDYELEPNNLVLKGEMYESGTVEDTMSEDESMMEARSNQIAVTFTFLDEEEAAPRVGKDTPLQVELRAFDQDLVLMKTR